MRVRYRSSLSPQPLFGQPAVRNVMDNGIEERFALHPDRAGVYFNIAFPAIRPVVGGEEMLCFLIFCLHQVPDHLVTGQNG